MLAELLNSHRPVGVEMGVPWDKAWEAPATRKKMAVRCLRSSAVTFIVFI
jgi:hypothetical protein